MPSVTRKPHVVFGEAIGESSSGLKEAMGKKEVEGIFKGERIFSHKEQFVCYRREHILRVAWGERHPKERRFWG